MKNRITKKVATAAILCALIMVLACATAFAASYSRVYGQTQDRLRVRASASTSSAVIDNIVKGAAVYITSSSTSGSSTYVKVNYRNADGDISSGWLCQKDSSETYVKVLSADQTKNAFNVSGGSLPSRAVGTYTASQRQAASSNAGAADVSTMKEVQTMLKGLGYYTGEITGNAGTKTVAAIKKFQGEYDLTADGVAGPNTYARLKSVYGGSASSSSAGALALNSNGTSVRNLQQDLTTLGYYWAEVTGNYGSKTEAAVKSFQQRNGLTADGVAGAKTLDAIAAAIARKGGTSANVISTSSILTEGSKGDAVSNLQKTLKDLGYYTGSVTGSFGSLTEAAVRRFQEANGLSADGVAGTKTIEAINKKAGSSGLSSASGLKLGSTGEKVRALQQDLTALGYYYGDITGHYGEMTRAAVLKFQKARKLTADGVAGTSTQNAISSALGNSGALSASSASASALREGDSGNAVEDLQTRLKKLGYYYGELTGSFGSLTKQAVRKFQDDNNLSVDGVAGAKTLSLLYTKTGDTYSGTAGGALSSSTYKYGRINKDNVNLRKSYSTTSGAITTLDENSVVRITKTYTISGMDWYYLYAEQNNYTYKGYVRSDLVDIITESEYTAGGGGSIDVGNAEVIGMIRVTGTKVNLREEDDSDSDRIGYAYMGDVFYYIDVTSDKSWYKTQTGAWIAGDYVEVLDEDEMDQYIDSSAVAGTYRKGDTGSMVLWIQETLQSLKYYDGELTGSFGNLTHEAVRDFQRDNDLSRDGIVGGKTLTALKEAAAGLLGGVGSTGSTPVAGSFIYNLDWFTYKNSGVLAGAFGIKKDAYGTLYDINSGKSFDIKIQSTGNHIDAEPKTASDTNVLASIYGVGSGSGLKGIYKRRPMILTMTGCKISVICSIYPEPHGDDTISGNGYDGQFCLHMLNSKTHETDRVDNDTNGHQEMIKKGVAELIKKGYAISTAFPATSGSVTGSTGFVDGDNSVDNGVLVTMHPDTIAYTNPSGSTYYHLDNQCATLLKAVGSAGVGSWYTTYSKVSGKKLCDDCKHTFVYYGDTSTKKYHYDPDCGDITKYDFDVVYKTTEFTVKLRDTAREAHTGCK